jgi:phosphatidylglycerophosphatase A
MVRAKIMKKPNPEDMKEQNNNLLHKLMILFLSWFGAGRAPKAPGTFGTVAALPFIYAWSLFTFPHWINFLSIALLTILACIAADKVQRQLKLQDPQWIVVDEVLGMALTWAIAHPTTPIWWAVAFGSFRFFDIVKIWPASYFDKKVKNGAGTILDDIVSGAYAGIFTSALSHFSQRF